jgi:prepilin-type N-terminal cleavage/methylation domain-containing protein
VRGVTLVEMLVALLLSSITLAGAITGLAVTRNAWRDAAIQARLHERAQYVFATLEPELQMAGLFLDAAGGAENPFAGSVGCGPLPATGPAIQVLEGSWPLGCPAQGGGARAGADMLVIRRAAAVGNTVSPGAAAVSSPSGTARHELRIRAYYVARSADGTPDTPALRVKSLTAVSGVPAFVDTEVMPGVEDLQIEVLPSPANPLNARVQLRLVARGADLPASDAPVLEIARRFALRNAVVQ